MSYGRKCPQGHTSAPRLHLALAGTRRIESMQSPCTEFLQ